MLCADRQRHRIRRGEVAEMAPARVDGRSAGALWHTRCPPDVKCGHRRVSWDLPSYRGLTASLHSTAFRPNQALGAKKPRRSVSGDGAGRRCIQNEPWMTMANAC